MKKTVCLALAALLFLAAGCAAQRAPEPAAEVSALFETPAPATPEPSPTPAPESLELYDLGGAVMYLPEGFEADVMDDGSFFLTGGTSVISGLWYDAFYFDYIGADYPETALEAAAQLVVSAGSSTAIPEGDGRCVVEYIDQGQTTEWAIYAVVTRGDSICWKVEFICPSSLYEELRPSFERWAAMAVLPESMENGGTTVMTSVTGLFTLELPYTCIVIDDAVTAEELSLYGLTEEDAASFLDAVREAANGADVVYRADFGAMLTVTVDYDADMRQAEMQELEDSLYINADLEGADYTYEGIVLVGDNPNLFYLVRIHHDGYDELGFTTAHDDTGASVTFSFVGFSDDEARDILQTLVMISG